MKKIIPGLMIMTMLATPVYAKDLFVLSGTVNGEEGSRSFKKIEDIVDAVEEDGLRDIFPNYHDGADVDVTLNLRGLDAQVQYDAANPNRMIFRIPALDYERIFDGTDRDDAQDQLEDFLKSNQDDLLKRMLQEMVATTAIDPVAGNPNSLLAKMGAADFTMGTDFGGGSLAEVRHDPSSENTFGIGLSYGRYSADGYDQDVINLPLSYTRRFEADPRRQLLIDLPLTYTDTEGGKTYGASLGLGYRHPINDDWSLTPALRIGAVGSVDLGSAAVVYSGSITSNYHLYRNDIKISIGNMAGIYQTSSISAGDYEVDYDLSNTMLKNGIGFEGPMDAIMFGSPTSWRFDLAHTALFGDDLYVDSYFDFAASFGTRATQSSWDRTRIGLTYTVGNNSFRGLKAHLAYHF